MRGSHKYYLVAFVAMMLLSGCVSMRYYDYVESDPPASIEIIQALKNDTIVVALSTYKEEEDIYKGAIRTASNKKKYQKKLDELIEVRRVEVSDMIKAFEEHFTFCEVLYMPDSLVHKFEDGEEGVFFLNYNGQLDPSITYSNRSPIKILRPSYTEWHVKIGNKFIPNPFPNNYNYRGGLLWILGLEEHEDIANAAAKTFQKRFDQFHAYPGRKILL